MASFINKLITAVEVIGAVTGAKQLDAVANSTDNVTKASTRLSNQSSNNSRGFAAQSKGLGGLVASYAGAAANIFAITQAYSALNKAARVDQVIEGTKVLASQIGESGSSIIANMRSITNGQLSMAQSAELANTALAAGFDSKQLSGLTEVAFKASRVLGRDLTDSLQRLVKGTAKLEPELLDELGIFTRLEPAVDKYASKLGVTAASLTEFQRRQAFANAAIDEGNRKFGVIQISANTTQASFERAAAAFSDLAQKIGSVVAGGIAPILEGLTANAGTSFLAIGAIGFIVFSKLFEQIGKIVKTGVKGLEELANNSKKTQAQLEQQAAAAAAARAAEAQQATAVAAGAAGTGTGRYIGSGGIGSETKTIMDRAKVGSATNTQMEADAKFIREKAIPAQEAYIATIKESARADESKAKAIASAQSRITALNTVQEAYVKAAAASTEKTQVLTAASSKLSTVMGVLEGVLTKVGKWINLLGIGIVAVQLIGTFFDKDLLGGISSLWDMLWEGSKNLKSGIEGIAAATLNVDAKKLSAIFSPKEITQINEKTQEKIKAANENATLGSLETSIGKRQQGLTDMTTTSYVPKDIGADRIASLNEEFKNFGITIDTTGTNNVIKITELTKSMESLQAIKLLDLIKDLTILEDQIKNTDSTSSSLQDLRVKLEATSQAIEIIKKQGDIYGGVTGSLAALLELKPDQVYNALMEQGSAIDAVTGSWTLNGVVVGELYNKQLILTDGMKNYAAASTRVADLTKNVNETLATGGATSEYLSKSVTGSVKSLEQYAISVNKKIASGKLDAQQVEALTTAYLNSESAVNNTVKALERLANAEKITKNIEKQFSQERISFEESVAKGYVDSAGKIAQSEQEVSANRLSFLSATVKTAEEAKAKMQKASIFDTNRSLYAEQIKAGNMATEAAVGASFKLNQEVKKTNDDLNKRILTLNNETSELEAQNALAQTRRDLTGAANDFARSEASRQSYITNVLDIRARQSQVGIDQSKAQLTLLNTRLSGEQAILEAQKNQIKAASDLAVARAERQGANALGPLKSQEAVQQALPDLYSTDQKLNLQAAIAKQEYDNALKIINLKAAAEQADYGKQLEILAKKQVGIQAEITQKEIEIANTKQLQQAQTEINNSTMKSERDKIAFDISQTTNRQKEITQQAAFEVQKVNNATQSRLEEVKLIGERVDIVYKEAEVFKAAAESNTSWVNKFIEGVNKMYNQKQITALTVSSNFDEIVKGAGAARAKIGEINTAIVNSGESQKSNIEEDRKFKVEQFNKDKVNNESILADKDKSIEIQKRLNDITNNGVIDQLEAEKKNAQDRITASEIESGTIKTNAAASAEKSQAEREAIARTRDDRLTALAIEKNTFLQLANSLAGIVKNNLNKGVDAFYDAIRNGTLTLKTFREGVVNVFKDILFDFAKEATKKLLITPITDAFTSSLGKIGEGIFGDLFKTGKDAATGAVAGATTGTCGCVGDALTKAVPAIGSAAGAGAGEIVAKAGAGAVTNGVISKATASSGGVIDLNTKVPATTPAAGAVQAATPPVVAAQTVTPTVDNTTSTLQDQYSSGRGANWSPATSVQDQYSSGRGANWSPATPAPTSYDYAKQGDNNLNSPSDNLDYSKYPEMGTKLSAASTIDASKIDFGNNIVKVEGTGAGGALNTELGGVASNANLGELGIGNIASNSTSNGLAPFSLTNTNTWDNVTGLGTPVLNPTGPGAFGSLGTPYGSVYNGSNNMTPNTGFTYGGTPAEQGNLGMGGGSTQFGNPADMTWGGVSGTGTGGVADQAAGLDPKIIEDFNTKVSDSCTNLDTFAANTDTGATNVQALADGSIAGADSFSALDASLVSNTVSLAASDAMTKTKTLTDTVDVAQKEIGMIADQEETLETGVATTNLVAFSGALSTATSAAASGGAVKAAGAATSGGGGLLSGLFGSFFGSSGGLMNPSRSWQRFAGGGSKKRDSIPALLEPGEFVIRKDATKKLGQNVLERMNATGKISDTQDKLVSNVESQLKDLTKADLTDPNSVKQLDKTIKLLDKTNIGADPSHSSNHSARLYGAGMKRFASGGGVKKIDSVPALLQPGEFVMKKSAVDAIGSNNLERMNASNKASSKPTNIKVQLENSGKEKEAEQGETQFDGETAIVKIILKDLSSNGPIRRSMRGL